MIQFSDLNMSDTLFTHIDNDNGKQTHYAVSRITPAAIKQGISEGWIKPALIPIEKSIADYCLQERGIEQHRLRRLESAPIPFTPLLFIEQDDGSHLLVDGSHRYVAYANRGTDQAPAYLISKDQNRRFVVENFPAVLEDKNPTDLLNSFSGIF